MKLSRTAHYAVAAMVHIAKNQNGHPVIGHKAAKQLNIPEGFLLRILVALARARLLWSIKGPNGGYRMADDPKKITLLQIIEAVDGTLAPILLFHGDESVDAKLRKAFEEITEDQRKRLGRVTVAELMKA